jgi:hypothetical protein
MADEPKKQESMTEAVEGFERDRAALNAASAIDWKKLNEDIIEGLAAAARQLGEYQKRVTARMEFMHGDHYFRRDDVLDLATAANDARQLAIAAPDLAEEANARAARCDDLAVRIAALLPPENDNG